MKTPNIDFIMEMAKSYLDGEMDCITYTFDFSYEIEKRYKKMVREDRDYAGLIYDCLVEEGTNQSFSLTDASLKS